MVGGEHQLFEQGRREQELEDDDHDRSRHDRWMDRWMDGWMDDRCSLACLSCLEVMRYCYDDAMCSVRT